MNILHALFPRHQRRMSNKAEKEEPLPKSENDGDQTEDPDKMSEHELWTKLMSAVKDMTVEESCKNFDGDRVIKMFVAETKDDVDVRARAGFCDVIARLAKGNNINISTLDNGADTRAVGVGWMVLIKTARKANLVGFDSNCAKKKGLPIVTADTAVKLEDESEVVIRTHETVHDEGSLTTCSFLTRRTRTTWQPPVEGKDLKLST